MSDENKTPELNEENTAPAVEQTAQSGEEALNDELNNLKDIFQKEWQKTVEESEKETPVIQELEDAGEPEEEPEENSEDEPNQDEPEQKKKKKAKKEGKKRSRVPLVILIILLILIIIPLLLYFVCSVKFPNFNNLITSYAAALSAEDDSARLSAYEDVLSYCEDGSTPEWFTQSIYEDVAVLKCKSEGYASALQYVEEKMSEEMIANAKSDEFKELLKVKDVINDVAGKAFEQTAAALDTAKSPADMDFDALANALGTPEIVKNDVIAALKNLAEGMAAEKIADTRELFTDAVSKYFAAISAFKSLGADTAAMNENIAVKAYDAGYLYETTYIIDNYIDEEQLDSPRTESFAAVLNDVNSLKGADIDVYGTALACYNNKTYSDSDLKDALNTNVPEKIKASLVDLAKTVIEGIESENEKNLTKASARYSEVLSTLEAFGLDASGLAKQLIGVCLKTGDTQNANTLKETYITDEVLADSDDAFKAQIDELTKLYDAQYAVNEVFYPFYYNAYAYGGELNKDEINAALDELVTDDADDYLKAFVSYYKYLAEGFTDEDTDTMLKYLNEFASQMKDYPVLYGSSLAEVYRMSGEYDKAEETAKQILDINIADDYANSIMALSSRIKGDADKALEIALKGTELTDSSNYCAAEAVIGLMLKGDFEKAFSFAKDLYEANMTIDNCEYIKIIAALYKGSDEDLKKEIDSLNADVDTVFQNYSITLSEKAQGIIDGTLTLEDVFLKAPYSLNK